MRLSALVVFIALFITAHTSSYADYCGDVQAMWAVYQCKLVTLHEAVNTQPLDKVKVRALAEATSNELGQYLDKRRPQCDKPELAEFDAALFDFTLSAVGVCDVTPSFAYGCMIPQFHDAVTTLCLAQQKVVVKSEVVGGLKPVRSDWIFPGAPAKPWTRLNIEDYASEASEDPVDDAKWALEILQKVRGNLERYRAEVAKQVSQGTKVNWAHYFRLLYLDWIDSQSATGFDQNVQTVAVQAVLAQFTAWSRQSQTGEKETAESQAADQYMIQLKAMLLPLPSS